MCPSLVKSVLMIGGNLCLSLPPQFITNRKKKLRKLLPIAISIEHVTSLEAYNFPAKPIKYLEFLGQNKQ